METLKEYINREHGGSQVKFAECNGVSKQQVYKWLIADFIVVDGALYSKRRDLKIQQLRN
ncbi:MAG: hypothetical protein DRQ62_14955 [Gammaproteobacteria bacterium]|nr:MAG: hypothetical protein DRQ62_14955 [Gammaproteobacteria bacterium]